MQYTKLTLTEALRSGRLADFVAQQEAEGIGPVDEAELLGAIEATVKPRRSKDRTSHSVSRNGSTGK